MTDTMHNVVVPAVDAAIAAISGLPDVTGYGPEGWAAFQQLTAAYDGLLAARDYLAAPSFTRSTPDGAILSLAAPVQADALEAAGALETPLSHSGPAEGGS